MAAKGFGSGFCRRVNVELFPVKVTSADQTLCFLLPLATPFAAANASLDRSEKSSNEKNTCGYGKSESAQETVL